MSSLPGLVAALPLSPAAAWASAPAVTQSGPGSLQPFHTVLIATSPWHSPWMLAGTVILVVAAAAGLWHWFKSGRGLRFGRHRPDQESVNLAQRRLAAILEHTSDLVAFADSQRKPVYINAAGRKMLGLDPNEDLAQFQTSDMYPKWANDLILREGLPTAGRQGVWRGQTAIRRRDGREIPVSQVITAHYRPDGALDFTSTIIRDITPLVEALQALESSQTRFRSYWDACPMGIHAYELQPDNRLVFVDANPASDRILGVDSQQFVGRTFEEAFPPLADTELAHAYRRAALEGLPFHTEQADYQHGQIRGAFEVYAFQTGPRRMAAMFLETTVRQQAELALRESEDRFRQLAGTIREVFYLIDWPDRHFVYVSPAFEPIWGAKSSDLYENPNLWSDPVHPSDQKRVDASLREQITTGEWTAVYRIVRPDTSVRWIRDRAFAVRDESGQIYRLAGVAEDITERHQAESAEQAFRRLAQSLVSTLFLHDLGHCVAAACRTLFEQDAFLLEVLNPDSRQRTPVYAEDTRPGAETPEEVERPHLELIPEWLARLQHGHTLILNQTPDADQPSLGSWGFRQRQSRSILLSPIVSSGRCIGLISLQSYTANRYQSRDADLLQTLANQCAGTLLRVQAEEQLRQLNVELEAKVRDRTNELQRLVNLMAGRETRMSELKQEIQRLRQQLQDAHLPPPASAQPDPPHPPSVD